MTTALNWRCSFFPFIFQNGIHLLWFNRKQVGKGFEIFVKFLETNVLGVSNTLSIWQEIDYKCNLSFHFRKFDKK